MYSNAYLEFLIEFHATRDYFECHEILEEHWKEDPPGKRKLHWVGLIQLAVALYHERRGNVTGAKRMYRSALRIIEAEKKSIEQLGIDTSQLQQLILERTLQAGSTFTDFMIPINDKKLLAACEKLAYERKVIWGSSSALDSEQLIHKHKLRDRSPVIKERERRLSENRLMKHEKK
ncbi:DUF309 domain-containing protein [Alkalihalophilus marmarensis]|uniref:DUF309 domain-containing protein n=1 Tax=Alkalihalophilus marmarensis TaxID=521377 RepID=UPI002DBE7E59|nr:DUF309 domain-containing protein [Alkalihalophilus marmarensis]MEC2070722.1 DUF309 domain-containing protein [Alkalihalophilus marmarensis]